MLATAGSIPVLTALGFSPDKANGEQPKKVIVAGGHPNDPETGCGGLMALLAEEGQQVIACYLTRGEAGIPNTSASEAAEINNQWYQRVVDYLEEEQPDVILTH